MFSCGTSMKTCPSWQLLLVCSNKFPFHHWAVLSHVFLFSDYQTEKWSSEITGRCKWWTSTYFLLPDTSVPTEPNPVTMQMEATYPPETLVPLYRVTWHHIPEVGNLHSLPLWQSQISLWILSLRFLHFYFIAPEEYVQLKSEPTNSDFTWAWPAESNLAVT